LKFSLFKKKKNEQSGTASRRRRRLSNSDSAAATSGALPGFAAKRKRSFKPSQNRVPGDTTAAEAARRQQARRWGCGDAVLGGRRRLEQVSVVAVGLTTAAFFAFAPLLLLAGSAGAPARDADACIAEVERMILGQGSGKIKSRGEGRESAGCEEVKGDAYRKRKSV